MHLGFSSVMYDGSTLPYKENVQHSAEAVRFANFFGATVEAEWGHVGGAEGGGDEGHQVQYTEPNEAARFVEVTGVDALAVSIGTSHGVYKEKPRLDIERLRAIKARTPVPLVLHGGSGLTDQDFRNCILGGISKVNIYTEIEQEATELLARFDAKINPGAKVKNLSISHQQIVEIAKAIALNCKVLIFDEPTTSLTEEETEKLFKIIHELKCKGMGILYISHRMDEIFNNCDRVTVLRNGHYIDTLYVQETDRETIVGKMIWR